MTRPDITKVYSLKPIPVPTRNNRINQIELRFNFGLRESVYKSNQGSWVLKVFKKSKEQDKASEKLQTILVILELHLEVFHDSNSRRPSGQNSFLIHITL